MEKFLTTPIIKFPVGLPTEDLSRLRQWIEACHEASTSRSPIKDEGLILLDEALKIDSWTSEAGVYPDQQTRGVLQRLLDTFIDKLRQRFAEEHQHIQARTKKLQFNVLSYKPNTKGETIPEVPYHQDRPPTTILFAFLVKRPEQGGVFEVLHLDSSQTTHLSEENWAIVFDDRDFLHRVHEMRGHRQSLTIRVW
jgi:hypothetical protein